MATQNSDFEPLLLLQRGDYVLPLAFFVCRAFLGRDAGEFQTVVPIVQVYARLLVDAEFIVSLGPNPA